MKYNYILTKCDVNHLETDFILLSCFFISCDLLCDFYISKHIKKHFASFHIVFDFLFSTDSNIVIPNASFLSIPFSIFLLYRIQLCTYTNKKNLFRNDEDHSIKSLIPVYLVHGKTT